MAICHIGIPLADGGRQAAAICRDLLDPSHSIGVKIEVRNVPDAAIHIPHDADTSTIEKNIAWIISQHPEGRLDIATHRND